MLDIIILVFIVVHIGNKARRKGQNVFKWRLLTVVAWLTAEFIGILIGVSILGFRKETFANLMLIALVSAFGGYLLIKYNLDKYPDRKDDIKNGIDQFGG